MSGYATLAGIQAGLVSGKYLRSRWTKNSLGGGATGNFMSHWQNAFGSPVAGSAGAAGSGTPGAGGTAHTSSSGGIVFDDYSSSYKNILSNGALSTQAVTIIVMDRLVSVSTLSTTAIATVNVNSATLPRYTGTDARYVQPWIEVDTAITVTSAIMAITYTNDSGTGSRVGSSLTVSTTTGILRGTLPLHLQSGDRGVRTVETLGVTQASTAGSVSVVLQRPLGYLYVAANIWNEIDSAPFISDLMRVYDGATLGIVMYATGNNTPAITGYLQIGFS